MFGAYTHWLHTRWPAGLVEKLPEVGVDGVCNVPGIRIVGDLSGIPLLKFSADTGARAVQAILKEPGFVPTKQEEPLDLVIVGAGVSGIAAALEAKKAGMSFRVYESSQPFATIEDFPRGKPIYTYPTDMTPAGDMRFQGTVKEALYEELEAQRKAGEIEPVKGNVEYLQRKNNEILVFLEGNNQPVRARRVIVAIGRSGNYRRIGIKGEDQEHVHYRLFDPKEYAEKQTLIIGGGDTALEAAIALAQSGAKVTLSYRKKEFSRPKPDNIEQLEELLKENKITLLLGSQVKEIQSNTVTLQDAAGKTQSLAVDVVFVLIGRDAPLDFFRRSGIRIAGEYNARFWLTLAAFFLFCLWLYHWKSYYYFFSPDWDPKTWIKAIRETLGDSAKDKTSLLYTLLKSASGPSFYYTLVYSICIGVFGVRRILRRPTPYVKWQTISLMLFQWLPLFLLPELLLPWLGRNHFFDSGFAKDVADLFFPVVNYDPGREYWRAYGFILAWPLFIYNWFTAQPLWGWLALGGFQTFVLIPFLIWRYGKGVYCGWICSCGALAETLGDTHRSKMPHGPRWNLLNMAGQVILFAAFALLAMRIWGWVEGPQSWAAKNFDLFVTGDPKGDALGKALSYKWIVDIFLGGVVGIGVYFHFSGRFWCRFFCPLAALMHIYSRFSRFRIFADKKKCISCNVCTSVCHQGIDIMSFANKGLPMQDPECVRCSACVQECPTGTLTFGRIALDGSFVYDGLAGSLVQIRERKSKAALPQAAE